MKRRSIHSSKAMLWLLLLPWLEIGLLLAGQQLGSIYAESHGSQFRPNFAYGITQALSFGVFAVAAFVLPVLWMNCRSKWPGLISFLCFLACWCLLLVPCLGSYPYRATFLLICGIIIAGGAGCVFPRILRRQSLAGSSGIESQAPFMQIRGDAED